MRNNIIALDAGHGSNTFERSGGKGVVRNGIVFEEHSFNAAVIIKLKQLLEDHGFSTFYTQPPNEKEISLEERTKLANEKNADLFWSVHANASNTESVRGVCSFYWHTSKSGKRIAGIFAENMKASGILLHGDGTHASEPRSWTNLHVVRETEMVALLTENGFMTNEQDLELLKSESYRSKIAKIHAKTICNYFGKEFKGTISEAEDRENSNKEQVPSWKFEGITYLHENGILKDKDQWNSKINDPMPVWAVTLLLKKIHEQLK